MSRIEMSIQRFSYIRTIASSLLLVACFQFAVARGHRAAIGRGEPRECEQAILVNEASVVRLRHLTQLYESKQWLPRVPPLSAEEPQGVRANSEAENELRDALLETMRV